MVKSLLLCEGGNDVGFFNKFCKYLKLNNIETQKISGKSNFFKEESYSIIKQKVNKGQYSKVLFIVDADYPENDAKYGGLANSTKCLIDIIDTLGFKNKAKYFITCDPVNRTGNLEHLVLSTLDIKQKKCIEELLGCVLDMNTHSDKKIVLSSYEAIFKESPYNLTHKNFENLTKLLKWLNKP